jgi:hypothetical protein
MRSDHREILERWRQQSTNVTMRSAVEIIDNVLSDNELYRLQLLAARDTLDILQEELNSLRAQLGGE